MKTKAKKLLALLLVLVLTLQLSDAVLVQAAETIDAAVNPAEQIELYVPDSLQDGSYFFIRENTLVISEKSTEKLYIPIQRSGDLSDEAEVTLKITDMTAHRGVNYEFEIYKDDLAPETTLSGVAIIDIVDNAIVQIEEEEPTEEELGEILETSGGADMVDVDGNVVGSLTAQRVDENGDSITDDADAEDTDAENADAADTDAELLDAEDEDDTAFIIAARNRATGTISDRQQLAGGSFLDAQSASEQETLDAKKLVEDSYPGEEYRLHFDAGQAARFVVVTPKYSDANDGDAQIMLFLKDASDGYEFSDDFGPAYVTITDEDERQPVVLSMADAEVTARDGKATITVTREGRKNDMVGVHIASWDGSAKQGDEYGGVGANLYFPMGITQRTIELPVGHGAEDKDFYVTLTTLETMPDVQIGTATAHVTIPAGEIVGGNGSLMADVPTDPALNLKAIFSENWGARFEYQNGDKGIKAGTEVDKEGWSAGARFTLPGGWYYDGLYIEFNYFLNYCDGKVTFKAEKPDSSHTVIREWTKDDHNGGWHWNNSITLYYGQPQLADDSTLYCNIKNIDNEGAVWDDSYANLHVRTVSPILRTFNIQVQDPVALDYIGMTADEVKSQYLSYIVNDGLGKNFSLLSGGSFSISAVSKPERARLVGVEVVGSDGAAYMLGKNDGASKTVSVTLDMDTVNTLGQKGLIQWSANGNSYSGTIKVRPVFDYNNVTVELADSPYGALVTGAPSPTILWDFNNNKTMANQMGVNWQHQVAYTGGRNGSDEYYTFTAAGNDPYVSMDRAFSADGESVRWVKIRAKTSSSSKTMQLFPSINGNRPNGGNCTNLAITNDGQWHEYIYDLKSLNADGWRGTVSWIRLDPLDGCRSGDTIQIDYVAFFPTQEAAQAFRSGSATALPAGVYNYHKGDRLNFTTQMSTLGDTAGLIPSGVAMNYRSSANGELMDKGSRDYINGTFAVLEELTYAYTRFEPTFTDKENQMVVKVADGDLAYFNTAKGLFAGVDPEKDVWSLDGFTYYRIDGKIPVNRIYELTAVPKDSTHVAVWTVPKDSRTFSGNVFYHRSNTTPEENLLTLSVDRTASRHDLYSISGSLYTRVMNLSTGMKSDFVLPVENATVFAGLSAGTSDEDGVFTLLPLYLVGGTTLRYAVSYNGVLNLQDVNLSPAGARKQSVASVDETGSATTVQAIPVSINGAEVENWNADGAHFDGVQVRLGGFVSGVIDAVEMNGRSLDVSVHVSAGQSYSYYDSDSANNGANAGFRTATENVKRVELFFRNQLTGQIRAGSYIWDASYVGTDNERKNTLKWDAATGTASFHIEKFKPDSPDLYSYGDVLMAVLTTDRKTGGSSVGTTYDPVSTGFAVIADLNYEPEVFDFDFDNLAKIMGVADPGENPAGLQEETTYSFGRFPYLGEITGAIKVIGFIASASQQNREAYDILTILEDIGDENEGALSDEPDGEGELMGAGALFSDTLISVAFNMKELTAYNGVRFMFAVVATKGLAGNTKNNNPYASKQLMSNIVNAGAGMASGQGVDLIVTEKNFGDGLGGDKAAMKSSFGGPHLKFSVYLGFYVDYGFITKTTYYDDGTVEVTGDRLDEMVTTAATLMGGGGFIGAKLIGGYTWITMVGPVPVYVNVDADIGITLFLGVSADPNKTLEARREANNYTGEDFKFNLELIGSAGLEASFGIGLYKVFGARIGAKAGLEAGYSLRVPEYYPQFSPFGYTTDITVFGTIDLIVTSIDLWRSSWALPWSAGFMLHTQQARRGSVLMELIDKGIGKGRGTQSQRDAVKARRDELYQHVTDCDLTGENLRDLVNSVQEFAYDNDIITWAEYNRVDMLRVGGIGGLIHDAVMFDDDSQGMGFRTRQHVDSQWVAGQSGALMSAFGAVRTEKIVDNAIAQPSAQIKPIGNNEYLVVFLDDNAARDTAQASTLMWTVYNAGTDRWTTPAAVQGGLTADGVPNLIDGGDKLILSWSSVPDAKYTQLKADVAAELAAQGVNHDDSAVQAYLEQHPTRVMKLMDIFSVEFSKRGKTFGTIEQISDDNYYDDTPQAVYDSASGDYIVYYYKTVQSASKYADETELTRLNDLVGANTDPTKTYTLLTYMLYNNQTTAADTFGNTHASGWARDYYFSNETATPLENQAAELARFGGQRFLSSAVPGQSDPPISDLAVCSGYNDLAVFAFTVDRDLNTDTTEDRELYLQFYRFSTHSTFVPVRIAGSRSVTELKRNDTAGTYAEVESTKSVTVAQPMLTRNGDSTWLFWREDDDDLMYLNVSELLRAKVSETEYAVHEDGTIADGYQLNIMKMDIGSVMTEDKITATDYRVISDEKDNLYVVWTDVMTYEAEDELTGNTVRLPAQEIYASAMIAEEDRAVITDEEGTAVPARWSKPYRLTRDNNYNDGIAIALDGNGGLIIVHNQYEMLTAETEAEIQMLYNKGMIDLKEGNDGKTYVIGSLNYPSEISLAVTRFDAVGSVEATGFAISDETPEAGQTVNVTAVLENTGLTTADGCKVDVYLTDKNGAIDPGKRIVSKTYDEAIPVNTARKYSFEWTVPARGVEGSQLAICVSEKKDDATYYEPSVYYTGVFTAAPDYELSLSEVTQDGDSFFYSYSVRNAGNAPVPADTRAVIRAAALYGDITELYGLDSDILETIDISNLSPGGSVAVEGTIDLPASLFNYCGYDALTLEVLDSDDYSLAATDEVMIVMEQPMNVTVNNDEALTLKEGDTVAVKTRCNATPFMQQSLSVIYTVDDPSVASVDAKGNLMGLSDGTTTLTATLLPSGRTASIPVTVSGSYTPYDPVTPDTSDPSGTSDPGAITVEVSGDEGSTTVSAAVSGNTAAVTAPTEAQLNEIAGRSRETGSVAIDLSGLPEEVTAVSIPAETVKAIDDAMEENAEGLTVKLPNSTVTFDAAALAAIAGQTTGTDLKLNVDPVTQSSLNAAQKKAIDDLDVQAVYDVYLTSNSKRITDFGGGKATVEVTHPMKDGQQADGFTVWYVAEDGTRERIPAGATARTVRFVVTHFSDYIVAYNDPAIPGACDRGDECPMSAFTDLDKTSWYHDGVHWALENAVMNGYDTGAFGPNDTTSRAMIVTMLYRMEGSPAVSYDMGFTDVADGAWYTEAVRWAAANGIVNGYDTGAFGPNDDLNREQLAAILYRYAKLKGQGFTGAWAFQLSFSDASDVPDWAYEAACWMTMQGVIQGTDTGKFLPKGAASRAQVATMLMRLDAIIG